MQLLKGYERWSDEDLLRGIAGCDRDALAVFYRLTHGTRSAGGERSAERVLSAAATCRQQNRSLFAYLRELLSTHNRGDPFPALA